MKTFCPICSDILLRHLCRSKVSWFCPRCHQEMPNFNVLVAQEKLQTRKLFYAQVKQTALKNPIKNNLKNLHDKSELIDLYINQDKKRLEVVNFILNKINIILVNTQTSSDKYIENKEKPSKQLKNDKFKIDALTKANFLRDSEIILLSICQAILVADNSILDSLNIQDFIKPNNTTKFLVEQSYFIDLMKTLVVDFVTSISFNSSQSAGYFISEISGYFEIVINLLIKLE